MASKKKKFNGEGTRLSDEVAKNMQKFFKELDGEKASNIYSMVLKEVELPMLKAVMEECKGNQTLASQVLGLNRGTLRTKLKAYNLL